MKAQLKSDLHFHISARYSPGIKESYIADKAAYDPCRIHPEANVLLLPGDIIEATEAQVHYMLEEVKDVTIPILYTAGNHEFYNTSIEEGEAFLRESFKGTNVTYLNKDYVVIDNVVFIGAMLWTRLNDPFCQRVAAAKGWSDFRFIEGLTIDKWQNMHFDHIDYIEKVLKFEQYRDMKKVVMTHFVPTLDHTPAQFKRDPYNAFFSSDLEGIMREDYAPELWVHGHTHNSFDTKKGKTRRVCNPYGYFPKAVNWEYNRELILEI